MASGGPSIFGSAFGSLAGRLGGDVGKQLSGNLKGNFQTNQNTQNFVNPNSSFNPFNGEFDDEDIMILRNLAPLSNIFRAGLKGGTGGGSLGFKGNPFRDLMRRFIF